MHANYIFLVERFNHFNKLIFKGALPTIRLRINEAAGSLGTFSSPHVKGRPSQKDLNRCVLRISNRYDLPQEVIEDTIIHEMIHYLIWYNGMQDTSPHGVMFKAVMEKINRNFNRHITVRHLKTAEMVNGDTKIINHYICVTNWDDGIIRVTDAFRSSIFDINRMFVNSARIIGVKWYYSQDPWFNRLRRSRSARAYSVDLEELNAHLQHAIPCYCTSEKFGPIKNVQ